MNCRDAESEIFALESAEASPVGALAQHVSGCLVCQELLEKVRKLDALGRALPEPEIPAPPKYLLEGKLARHVDVPPVAGRIRRTGSWKRSVAAAVIFAVGIGLSYTALFNGTRANAETVLGDLVEWNVQIAKTDDPAERKRIHDQRVNELKREVQNAGMSAEDRAAAEDLLKNASWLATEQDSVEQAKRFVRIADELLNRRKALGSGTTGAAYEQLYRKVVQEGLGASMQRLDPKVLTPSQQREVNQIQEQVDRHLSPAPVNRKAGARVNVQMMPRTIARAPEMARPGGFMPSMPERVESREQPVAIVLSPGGTTNVLPVPAGAGKGGSGSGSTGKVVPVGGGDGTEWKGVVPGDATGVAPVVPVTGPCAENPWEHNGIEGWKEKKWILLVMAKDKAEFEKWIESKIQSEGKTPELDRLLKLVREIDDVMGPVCWDPNAVISDGDGGLPGGSAGSEIVVGLGPVLPGTGDGPWPVELPSVMDDSPILVDYEPTGGAPVFGTIVPEPGTGLMLLASGVGLLLTRVRMKKAVRAPTKTMEDR